MDGPLAGPTIGPHNGALVTAHTAFLTSRTGIPDLYLVVRCSRLRDPAPLLPELSLQGGRRCGYGCGNRPLAVLAAIEERQTHHPSVLIPLLLVEEGDACGLALISDRPYPVLEHRAGLLARLGPDDHPVDPVQVEPSHVCYEWLDGEEPDRD